MSFAISEMNATLDGRLVINSI